jgi:hypothetical protein
MGKLAEYLKTEGGKLRAEKAKRQVAVREWVGALDSLFRQIESWLAASDPDGLIERTRESVVEFDPALGEYEMPVLRISLGDWTVRIKPRARYVAATVLPPGQEKPVRAHGLVETRNMVGAGYYLFQLPDGKWYIQSEAGPMAPDNRVELFDPERFEAAMWSLLR